MEGVLPGMVWLHGDAGRASDHLTGGQEGKATLQDKSTILVDGTLGCLVLDGWENRPKQKSASGHLTVPHWIER
jgi:hypothetical protein